MRSNSTSHISPFVQVPFHNDFQTNSIHSLQDDNDPKNLQKSSKANTHIVHLERQKHEMAQRQQSTIK